MFHVFFKKYVGDPTSIMPLECFSLKEKLSYEEVSIEILDRQVWKLRNKKVSSVKVWESVSWGLERPRQIRCPVILISFPSLEFQLDVLVLLSIPSNSCVAAILMILICMHVHEISFKAHVLA